MPGVSGSGARCVRLPCTLAGDGANAVGGIIYLVLWVYGMLIDHTSEANFVPVNNADNWLHLGLAVGMIALSQLPRTSRPVVR